MAKNDTMYERGYNISYNLEFYAPNILERAMDGLQGDPKEFFEGLRQGQIQAQKEINGQKEKDMAKEKEKQDSNSRTDEREREAQYQDKLKREREAEQMMKRIWEEIENDPYEREERLKAGRGGSKREHEQSAGESKIEERMKEIEEIRGERGKEMERG